MNIGKSREELARDYGVSRPTFYKMLKRAGIELPARVALSPAELALVYEKLGPPPPPDPLRRKNSTFAIRGGGVKVERLSGLGVEKRGLLLNF